MIRLARSIAIASGNIRSDCYARVTEAISPGPPRELKRAKVLSSSQAATCRVLSLGLGLCH